MSDERFAVEGHVGERVQGVFYRASMQAEAERLGVQGWVRNRSDGRVGFFAQGERPAVEALLRWSEQGPPEARVTEVKAEPVPPREDLVGFEVSG